METTNKHPTRELLEKESPNVPVDIDDEADGNDDDISKADAVDEDRYKEWFHSNRSSTGLETGIQVTWPGASRSFFITTVLPCTEIAPLFHGTQWAGTRIWSAAVVASQYLLSQYQTNDNNRNSSTKKSTSMVIPITAETCVLELGCGLGIPGILLHDIVKCPVVLTDKESLVGQMQTNISTIFGSNHDGDDGGGGREKNHDDNHTHKITRIKAHGLDWSEAGVQTLLRDTGRECMGFDLVLNCDCVYEVLYGRQAWQALIACQRALLRVNPRTILITSLERRRGDGVDDYLKALRDIALDVQQIFPDFEYDSKVELYVARGLQKE